MSNPVILVVNLGATSSKFALYGGENCLAQESVQLSFEQSKLPVFSQVDLRLDQLNQFIAKNSPMPIPVAAVASRGGLMKPLPQHGTYLVSPEMLEDLHGAFGEHPSNLSAIISTAWASEQDIHPPVYVVDPVSVDMLCDEAKVSGVPEITRLGRHHALNVHHAAKQAASRIGKPLETLKMVVAHFGSGVSICAMVGERVIDVNDAQLGEGPFSIARAGTLPIHGIFKLLQTSKITELQNRLARASGMSAFTGTSDFIEIEALLDKGDVPAKAAYDAMVFQSAKYIAAYAGSLGCTPDAIVLTGGLVMSNRFVSDISQRVDWVAPIITIPGEEEMQALANGVLSVLTGNRAALAYGERGTTSQHAPQPGLPPSSFNDIIALAPCYPGCRFVVAGGNQQEIAETVAQCHKHGISGFVLVGPGQEIARLLRTHGVSTGDVEVIDAEDVIGSAIEEVGKQANSVLVKGKCNTAGLLKAVLGCLPEGSEQFLSHVAVIENLANAKLMGISDGGLNLLPSLDQKMGMLNNALKMFHALGFEKPKVLLAAGMEDKGQDIPQIADAREIVRRHREGAWADALIDGPFGLDIAFSKEAADLKGIRTDIAGEVDIVITPNLESCNFTVKIATTFTARPWGGVVVGGPFPVIVGSRADDALSRVCSIALAQLVAAGFAKTG